MVYSSNMNIVLVFPLLLAFISGGCSHNMITQESSDSCHVKCPAGYYKVGDCDGQKKIKCKKCGNDTYTDIENTVGKCLRCKTCSHYERKIRPCTFNSDVECDCKEGYYYENKGSCKSCANGMPADKNNTDYQKKCLSCQSECLNDRKCQMKCAVTKTPATTTSTTISTRSVTATPSTASVTTLNPIVTPVSPKLQPTIHYIWLVLGVVIFALVSLILLLRNILEHSNNCIPWRTKKVEQHVEDPRFSEQRSHQDITSATLTLNICEETPMMSLGTSENPAHISPPLSNTVHKAARQDEPSKHWPAIVLYAIIKEVPLRRWKEFLRLLSVDDEQLERAELEAGLGLGSMERQYQMLRLWSQRPSATLDDVFSAMHYMNLTGCAQLLQENLEKLQWSTGSKQGVAACRNYTDY